LTLIGRSSSSFTRIARIFAAELGVSYAFQILRNLAELNEDDYGGNPALKVPSLRTAQATWFGALNVCRELARHATVPQRIVWPEALEQPLLANAQELVLHALSTEVALIMGSLSGQATDTPHRAKMTRSLSNVLTWLDGNWLEVRRTLPGERDLSYLEVALFCLVAHLDFRKVVATEPYARLSAFRDEFRARPACQETEYRFDT
jgi:glutathione S-transferase